LQKKIKLGAAYAHSKPDAIKAVNYKAINTSFTPSANFAINTEYAKSSADTANKAYLIGGTYSWSKNSFSATHLNVDNNGNDAWNSVYSRIGLTVYGRNLELGNAMKGWMYSFNHQITKNTSLSTYYLDVSTPGYSGHDKEGFVELSVKF